MKMFLSAFLLIAFISPAAKATVILQPGQNQVVNGELVVCGGGSAQPQQPWTCACFTPNGKNVGTVTVYSSDKQNAVEASTEKCRYTFHDYTLAADPVACGLTP